MLVGKEGRVKVADFGLARDLTECEYYRKTGDGKVGQNFYKGGSWSDRLEKGRWWERRKAVSRRKVVSTR